jgi:hypothetical protein
MADIDHFRHLSEAERVVAFQKQNPLGTIGVDSRKPRLQLPLRDCLLVDTELYRVAAVLQHLQNDCVSTGRSGARCSFRNGCSLPLAEVRER